MALRLNVMFSENATLDCGYEHKVKNEIIVGCVEDDNITLQLGRSEEKTNYILAHEIGHYLFSNNWEVKNKIRRYLPLREYPSNIYDTQNKIINEMVADYFAEYTQDRDFRKKYPDIADLFDRNLTFIKPL